MVNMVLFPFSPLVSFCEGLTYFEALFVDFWWLHGSSGVIIGVGLTIILTSRSLKAMF